MGFATTLLTGQQIWTLFEYPGKKNMKWMYITVNVSEIKWMLNQSNATAMLQSISLYAIFV